MNHTRQHLGAPSFTGRGAPTAVRTLDVMLGHWREVGLPDFAQFDNDTRFQGAHQHADVISRVMRLCLHLGVTPVFTVPREHGFQNRLENFNGRWQTKVWSRFHHDSLAALQARSQAYVQASRLRLASRLEASPERRPVPAGFVLDLHAPLHGHIIFLRRTSDTGTVELLQHRFRVDATWPHRLIASFRPNTHPRPIDCPACDNITSTAGRRIARPVRSSTISAAANGHAPARQAPARRAC